MLNLKLKLILAGILLGCIPVIWLHGYSKGKSQERVKVLTETIRVEKSNKGMVNETRRKEQSATDSEIDTALCALGIMRENRGCK